ncbi:hypothetical protein CSPB12327_07820 [Campylobacter sp. RM12327]|uniref:hypothetical protein n=1 Tax=Campylobacter sputorum TaxID=206 RepID=UPI000B7772B5|nr:MULTISPECIES: hypothetical protein [Campylobacter]ASM39591.1 hypothetical protein CSPB_0331 [Campylobacter sputorum]MBE7358772.1 hypothetical protein [Campylobacter sp. RM11302]MBF6670042.1 hypothetical protein [Campylobacter sp. RM12327]MBF6675169.1 hypothetical protein [Campylobacter sp. RM13538]MBF6676785.1 hypothetical protein [Campylobacter sp. RM12321]
MKKRLLTFGTISFLAILLLVFVFYLWSYANTSLFVENNSSESLNKQIFEHKEKKYFSWIEEFAVRKNSDYSLPVNKIYIKVGSPKNLGKITQLIIDKNSFYSMFCVSQTLKHLGVEFSVIKDETQNLIYLYTGDKELLQKIVSNLKTYDINSKTKEIVL